MKALKGLCSKYDAVTLLLVYQRYLEIKPSLEYDTWHCTYINFTLSFLSAESLYRLNRTLGTDIKSTLSFLSAESLC